LGLGRAQSIHQSGGRAKARGGGSEGLKGGRAVGWSAATPTPRSAGILFSCRWRAGPPDSVRFVSFR
jgi:hypothetical protein